MKFNYSTLILSLLLLLEMSCSKDNFKGSSGKAHSSDASTANTTVEVCMYYTFEDSGDEIGYGCVNGSM